MKKTLEVLVATMIVGGLLAPALGQVTNVTTGGAEYTTLAAAISAATAGDTLRITQSPHTESNIQVNKTLTIEGLGGDWTYGSALRLGPAEGYVWNCTFVSNRLANGAGGSVISGGNSVTVESCVFANNI